MSTCYWDVQETESKVESSTSMEKKSGNDHVYFYVPLNVYFFGPSLRPCCVFSLALCNFTFAAVRVKYTTYTINMLLESLVLSFQKEKVAELYDELGNLIIVLPLFTTFLAACLSFLVSNLSAKNRSLDCIKAFTMFL